MTVQNTSFGGVAPYGVRAAVQRLTAGLFDWATVALSRRASPLSRVGLADGKAGVAVALSILAPGTPSGGHKELGERLLRAAIRQAAKDGVPPGLFHGLAGVAWAAMVCGLSNPSDTALDRFVAIDERLFNWLRESGQTMQCDLISGIAGIAAYALARPYASSCAKLVDESVRALECTTVFGRYGAAWTQSGNWREAAHATPRNSHRVNLGVAHGVPGIVAVLALAQQRYPSHRTARLFDASLAWLMDTISTTTALFGRLPQWQVGTRYVAGRDAWCYGDAGVGSVLLSVAQITEDLRVRSTALELLRRSARRGTHDHGVNDAGFCHGSAGLAHIFHRAFCLTGDATLRDAATTWFNDTLQRCSASPAIRLYSHGDSAPGLQVDQGLAMGLLSGLAGTALVLDAALHSDRALWDMPFLVSAPSTGAA